VLKLTPARAHLRGHTSNRLNSETSRGHARGRFAGWPGGGLSMKGRSGRPQLAESEPALPLQGALALRATGRVRSMSSESCSCRIEFIRTYSCDLFWDPLRGSSVDAGTMQRRSAWPLREDDAHESRGVNSYDFVCRPSFCLRRLQTHSW